MLPLKRRSFQETIGEKFLQSSIYLFIQTAQPDWSVSQITKKIKITGG